MRHLWLLLLLCASGVALEVDLDNETAFWTSILDYADAEGIDRNYLYSMLKSDLAVAEDNVSHAHDMEEVAQHHEEHEHHGVKVASWKFDYVKEPLVLTFFIVVIGLFKLVYHHTTLLQRFIPESSCLVLLGVAMGLIFIGDTTHTSVKFLEFNSKTFFFFLLPPIILEAAYSLKDKAFIENLGTIVLYAVVGTVLNIILIGGGLVVFEKLGWMGNLQIEPLDCLVFAALIAAVDPVAVLAIFQEVGVNKMLYFMVFGESLLNDAVTVVCYNLINEFREVPEIRFVDCFMGLIAFCCVSLGALSIGLLFGILSAYITKFTEHVRVVEPVIMFGMAYLAYMCSELFHFSGIIGIIACGLFQGHYSSGNISSKSFISVTYFVKVASSVSESLIFIVLGVMLVNEQEWFWGDWHPLFSFYAVILCLIARFFVTFLLTYIVNQFTGGVRYISVQEQLIMAYGGLRGAVSFCLAFMISDDVPVKNTLLAATYMVILFTIFIQGSTIKALVGYLNIRLARKEDNFRLFLEFNRGMISHMTQGIEDVCGYQDKTIMHRVSVFSRNHVRPFLEKGYEVKTKRNEDKLIELDRAANMRDALRSSPSHSSLRRQATIDDMVENGEIPRDIIEDEENFLHRGGDETEQKTDELTKDIGRLRKLMTNPFQTFYSDRNLKDEQEREDKQQEIDSLSHLKEINDRANKLANKSKRSIFGGRRNSKRSASQGLIIASIGSLGVHTVDSCRKDSIAESINEEDEPIEMKADLYTISEGDGN